jgi:hypothetical protein
VKRGLVIFLTVAAVLSCDRQRRPAELPAGLCELPLAPEGDASAGESSLAALGLRSSKQLGVWPLLVLDAGAFQTRCRWCGWVSSRQRGLEAALTAFEVHACGDLSP